MLQLVKAGGMRSGGLPPPALSVSPSSVSGSRTGDGTCTTGSVTVTATGGVPPYSYSWACTRGTPSNPTSATSAFSTTVVGVGTYNGVATCTVLDSGGKSATITVPVSYVRGAVPPTYSISPNPGSQSRSGAGVVNFTFTATVSSWGDASPSSTWQWLVGETGVGTILSSSGNPATFGITLSAGQTRTGNIQFSLYTDVGAFNNSVNWTATAT